MRVLCLDYGKKRTGIAVTDSLRIIATSLGTIETRELVDFLKRYFSTESVSLVLIGVFVVIYLGVCDSVIRGFGLSLGDADISTGRFHYWRIATQIDSAARQYLSPEDLVIVVVGDRKQIDDQLATLGMNIEYLDADDL